MTLLDLDSDFAVFKNHGALMASRTHALLCGQAPLLRPSLSRVPISNLG